MFNYLTVANTERFIYYPLLPIPMARRRHNQRRTRTYARIVCCDSSVYTSVINGKDYNRQAWKRERDEDAYQYSPTSVDADKFVCEQCGRDHTKLIKRMYPEIFWKRFFKTLQPTNMPLPFPTMYDTFGRGTLFGKILVSTMFITFIYLIVESPRTLMWLGLIALPIWIVRKFLYP